MGLDYKDLIYLSTFKDAQDHFGFSRIVVTREQDQWFTVVEKQEPSQPPQVQVKYSGSNGSHAVQTAELVLREKLLAGAEPMVPFGTHFHPTIPVFSSNKLYRYKLYVYSDMHNNNELFTILRRWRRKEAARARMAPYLIASDRLLYLLAAFVPLNEMELIQLPGIADKKLELYGDTLLAILQNFPQRESFPLDWVAQQVSDVEAIEWALNFRIEREARTTVRKQEQMMLDQALLDLIDSETRWAHFISDVTARADRVLNRLKQLQRTNPKVQLYMEREIQKMPCAADLLRYLNQLKATDLQTFQNSQVLLKQLNENLPYLVAAPYTMNQLKFVVAYLDIIQTDQSYSS
ncbi:MAG: aldolase [Bacilli bacterium]|nr:aldolase [Bacilli bacterium]